MLTLHLAYQLLCRWLLESRSPSETREEPCCDRGHTHFFPVFCFHFFRLKTKKWKRRSYGNSILNSLRNHCAAVLVHIPTKGTQGLTSPHLCQHFSDLSFKVQAILMRWGDFHCHFKTNFSHESEQLIKWLRRAYFLFHVLIIFIIILSLLLLLSLAFSCWTVRASHI